MAKVRQGPPEDAWSDGGFRSYISVCRDDQRFQVVAAPRSGEDNERPSTSAGLRQPVSVRVAGIGRRPEVEVYGRG